MLRRSAAALLACLPALAADASAATVKVSAGVVYGSAAVRAGQAPLLLDLYRPAKASKARRPVVVIIHGGGFRQGSRRDPGGVRVARALAARGIVAASIDYRLIGQEPVPSRRVRPLVRALPDVPISVAMAAAADDTLSAIAYLRRNAARLRIDVRRLGLVGSSAGAITADHVAYALDDHGIAGPRVRFVASLWGGIAVKPPRGSGPPTRQLERGEASLFAVHGDADQTVPVALSDELASRARRQRVRHEYHRLRGGGHGYVLSQFFTRDVGEGQTPLDRLLAFARAEL